ncbi:MAG: hypothetical protein H7Y27_03375, partial [Gemmatimonadaceae bacterium]|nr:hypothetical protein [Chitinophagaceae bacterium]
MSRFTISSQQYGEEEMLPDIPLRYPNLVWSGAAVLSWYQENERLVFQIAEGEGYVLRFGVLDAMKRIALAFHTFPHVFFVRVALFSEQHWLWGRRKHRMFPGQFQVRAVRGAEELNPLPGKTVFIDAFCSGELAAELSVLFPRLQAFLERAGEKGFMATPVAWAPSSAMEELYNCMQSPTVEDLEEHLSGDRMKDLFTILLKQVFDGEERK